ncbi:MAG: hypothetical protein H0X63_06610, partial [Flavobacteriales bacterium]|nr:hypothetical protein [Flavobacteriales bacterium]
CGHIKSTAFKLANLGVYSLLIAHFIIIGLYLLPENPLQHQFKKELNSYADPFFSQAWTLFAPTPINTNMSLLLRFEYVNNGEVDTTNWIDITEPLIEVRLKNYWSPAQRISKFTQSSMSNVNDHSSALKKFIEETDSLKNNDSEGMNFYYEEMNRSYGYKSIFQYSIYVAKKYFQGNDLMPEQVSCQFKIFNARFPRFSKRNEDYYDFERYEFSEYSSKFVQIKLNSDK